MSSRDNNSFDPRWPTGREPRLDQRQTSHARPSREDDRNSAAYNAPRLPQGYQVAPPQPPYNPVYPQYPPPHSVVPVEAFPLQRAPTQPFPGPTPYAPLFQGHPAPAPAPWIPPPPSLSNTGSGNTESRAVGGVYNNNSSRTDYRSDTQISASLSSSNALLHINNLHIPPPGPLAVTSGAFPSVPSGNTTRSMTQLTSQMRDTTISSSERRIESRSHVPDPGDADFENRYGDLSRNNERKSKKSKQTIPGQLEEDEHQYQWGYPGEGSGRPVDPRAQPSGHRADPARPQNIPQPLSQGRRDYSPDSRDPSRMGIGKGDRSSRKNPKASVSGYTDHRADRQPSRRRGEDSDDSSSSSDTAALTGNPAGGKSGGRRSSFRDPSTTPRPPVNTRTSDHTSDPAYRSKTGPHPWVEPPGHRTADSVVDGEAPRFSSKDSPTTTRPLVDPRTSYPGPYPSGPSITTSHPWAGVQPVGSGDSQPRSSHKGKESDRSSEKYKSSRQDPRTSQPQSWTTNPTHGSTSAPRPTGQSDYQSASSNRAFYPEQETHASWSNSLTSVTSVPKVGEVPPSVTAGPGWRGNESSRKGTHGPTNPYNPYGQDTTRTAPGPSQNEVPYPYPSQGQGSSGFAGRDGEKSRSSRRDSSSNQSIGVTERGGSHPWSGPPTSASEGRSTHLPHQGPIGAPPMQRATQSYPPSHHMSRQASVVEGEDAQSISTMGTYINPQRRLADIQESQLYNHSQQTLVYKDPSLGNPSLVPFVKEKNFGVKNNIDSHIPLYMCSNIIDRDTVAFWYPGPNLVAQNGGRRGVQLGDLGYFDDAGEFRPIFNIFRSYDDNIKEGAHPPSQPYQSLRIDFRSVVRQVDIPRQNTFTSANIERLGQEAGPRPPNLYQFRTYNNTGRSGAIVILPHGGSSSCIRNSFFHLPEVKRHFRDHAPSWYQHARQHIPNMANGSLVLVRATHCARSWGIAAFASKQAIKGPLYATFSSNPANEYEHMWQTSDNRWRTSTGPSSRELRESRGREPQLNQCLGAVISSLLLDEDTWQANFDPFSKPTSIPDGGSGGWGLTRFMSRSSLSSIHVQDDSVQATRGLLASFRGRPTERSAILGDDDYILLCEES